MGLNDCDRANRIIEVLSPAPGGFVACIVDHKPPAPRAARLRLAEAEHLSDTSGLED